MGGPFRESQPSGRTILFPFQSIRGLIGIHLDIFASITARGDVRLFSATLRSHPQPCSVACNLVLNAVSQPLFLADTRTLGRGTSPVPFSKPVLAQCRVVKFLAGADPNLLQVLQLLPLSKVACCWQARDTS